MQAIITAGRTGFGSPGQVMAAKNGPVGPKFTPDQIFRDRHALHTRYLSMMKAVTGYSELIPVL